MAGEPVPPELQAELDAKIGTPPEITDAKSFNEALKFHWQNATTWQLTMKEWNEQSQ